MRRVTGRPEVWLEEKHEHCQQRTFKNVGKDTDFHTDASEHTALTAEK